MFGFFTTRKMPPATDNDLHEQRKRNEARIEQIKQEMGSKWILHPDHKKTRLTEPRPV